MITLMNPGVNEMLYRVNPELKDKVYQMTPPEEWTLETISPFVDLTVDLTNDICQYAENLFEETKPYIGDGGENFPEKIADRYKSMEKGTTEQYLLQLYLVTMYANAPDDLLDQVVWRVEEATERMLRCKETLEYVLTPRAQAAIH